MRIRIGDLGFRRGDLIGRPGIEEAVESHFFFFWGLECEDDHCREGNGGIFRVRDLRERVREDEVDNGGRLRENAGVEVHRKDREM